MEITIVYSEPEQIKDVKDDGFILLDENNFKTRKKAFQAKGAVGARKTPLVIVKSDDGEYLKVFYREEFEDPIKQFNQFYKQYKELYA